MGVYTKTGDKGTTGLLTGERVEKCSLRVEAYGTIDEFSSTLGMARAFCTKQEVKDIIFNLQKLNMSLMAQLASSTDVHYIKQEHITEIEHKIDDIETSLPPLKGFLVAGETKGGAMLDLARTTARRAERCMWRLKKTEAIDDIALVFINRLSDFCFVLMRLEEN